MTRPLAWIRARARRALAAAARPVALVRSHACEIRDGVIHLWWIFVIVMPLCGLALWLAVDHANANQKRDNRRNDARLEAKFEQLIAISDTKHRDSLHSQSILFAYSINKSVCGLRGFAQPQLDRAIRRREIYPTLTPAERALNENAIKTGSRFLATQVTVPSNFRCSTLPKKPPKAGAKP